MALGWKEQNRGIITIALVWVSSSQRFPALQAQWANREAMHSTDFRATRPSWDISKGDAAYVELLESLADLEKSHKKQQIVSCLAGVTISNYVFFFSSI